MDTKLKSVFLVAAIVALLGIAASSFRWLGQLPELRLQTVSPRTLVASGEGKIEVKPNMAIIQAAIEVEGKTPELVQKTNDDQVRLVVAFLKEQGIASTDVQTTNYNLSPVYSYPRDRQPQLTGYRLTQGLTVKVRDLPKAGGIMGALTTKGVNRIDGLSFDIDKPEQFLAEARTKAITQAREQAQQIANGLGVKIGRVLNYTEGGSSAPPPVPFRMMSLGVEDVSSAPTPIEPGSRQEQVNVTITFELE